MNMSNAKAALVAAAFLSLSMVGSAAAAVPVSNLSNVAKASAGIQDARWVCGPFRCFWRPNVFIHRPLYGFYRPHRVWHRPLFWHRPLYGFYRPYRVWHRPVWHRPLYGFYRPHRVWHRWGWRHF
jgi:hypothetical protein